MSKKTLVGEAYDEMKVARKAYLEKRAVWLTLRAENVANSYDPEAAALRVERAREVAAKATASAAK